MTALFTRVAGYTFTLTVTATAAPLSTPRAVTVVCVGGNSPPVFTAQSMSVPETVSSGSQIGSKLVASDYENDTLTFSLSSVAPASAFK